MRDAGARGGRAGAGDRLAQCSALRHLGHFSPVSSFRGGGVEDVRAVTNDAGTAVGKLVRSKSEHGKLGTYRSLEHVRSLPRPGS
eukprot:4144194-Prymnesium_polylepis.2